MALPLEAGGARLARREMAADRGVGVAIGQRAASEIDQVGFVPADRS